MNRTRALVAVGVAAGLAAVVVAVGLASDGGLAARRQTSMVGLLPRELPGGHPPLTGAASQAAAADTGTGSSSSSERLLSKLERRRAKNPEDVGVLLELGRLYLQRHLLSEAELAFSAAHTAAPSNPATRIGLANVWYAQGRLVRARAALRSVIAAHPDNQQAHYTLAIVHFSSGRVAAAKAEWLTTVRLNPGSPMGRRARSFIDLLDDGGNAASGAD